MSDELITNERAMEFDRQVSQVFAKLRPCNFSQEEFRGEVGGLLMRLEYAHMTAATQAQAAAERAVRERDEAYASLTACSEAGIQVTRQKISYRNRALALLKQAAHHRRVARVRAIGNEALDVAVNMVTREKARAIAAEARADALRAALSDMIDLVLDGCVNSMALPEYLRDGDTITVERGYADKFRAAHAALAAAAPGDETERGTRTGRWE